MNRSVVFMANVVIGGVRNLCRMHLVLPEVIVSDSSSSSGHGGRRGWDIWWEFRCRLICVVVVVVRHVGGRSG